MNLNGGWLKVILTCHSDLWKAQRGAEAGCKTNLFHTLQNMFYHIRSQMMVAISEKTLRK